MDISNIKEDARQKELAALEYKLKRTVRLCKAIWSNWPSIEVIKIKLEQEDDLGASEAWNELDESTQNLLITAPLYGGPFTTKERAKLTELWDRKQA